MRLLAENSSVIIALCIFRFILGVGIGGEYPLSATITGDDESLLTTLPAETSQAHNRGRKVAAVFSMQGVGSLTASLAGMVLLRSSIASTDLIWRLCLAFGIVPGILSMYFRIRMHETAHFKNAQKQSVDYLRYIRQYWLQLLGTAGGWFILDITFYANGLFSSTLLTLFGVGTDPALSVRQKLIDISTFNVYLALMALPGYWLAVYLLELPFFGRKNTQLIGFTLLAGLYFLIGGLFETLQQQEWAFLLLYGLTFFVTNAGPNTTTYCLPSECFPTRIRATFHGISAAMGKAGAVVGGYGMAYFSNTPRAVMFACGIVALSGALLTVIAVKETRGAQLEDLEDSQVTQEAEAISRQDIAALYS